ncbi:MAG TPA: nucleotide sugar dehydrogenase [Candidatus Sumerlaeota bacterium]|nr:nucleotide sugar dehydrogenase [Candidatus Sumerlaeota bacterium]
MKAAVIGMGYVGLPLAIEMFNAGHEVIGIDVHPGKVAELNAGRSYVGDVPTDVLAAAVKSGKLSATTDFSALKSAKAVCICVPTPLRKTKDPDISYILAAVEEIAKHLQKGQIIILESTTYPGTTDECVLSRLEESGLKAGRDFFLAFSPERVDPGNLVFHTKNTPKIIGGITPACTRHAVEFYETIFDNVIKVSSCRCAEMVKLLENTFRSVNIGLVNEMAVMCDKLGLDVWEVIDAASSKPFGFMPFYPGPGLGGHCIPIDPHYLSWKLKSLNYYAKFIEIAGEINSKMPEYVVEKITLALNARGKSVKGSRILLLGVAYKKDVNDIRESPALDIIHLLSSRGAKVRYNDPHIPSFSEGDLNMKSAALTPRELQSADCVLIITNHNAYDYKKICDHARLVMDTRNATRKVRTKTPIIKL